MSELEIVNIVSSGRLGVELDLQEVASSERLNGDSRISSIEHSQNSGQRVLVRFSNTPSLVILSRKGACIITGAKSHDDVARTQKYILELLCDENIISDKTAEIFEIQNVVYVTQIGESINLNALTISIGFERVEYEPEQFPGLVFRPEDISCVILVFGSGKVVITGGQSKEEAIKAKEKLQAEISKTQL